MERLEGPAASRAIIFKAELAAAELPVRFWEKFLLLSRTSA
jgi:hypothetical protein